MVEIEGGEGEKDNTHTIPKQINKNKMKKPKKSEGGYMGYTPL